MKRDEVIIFLGNPGICEFYTAFARRLRDKVQTPVTVHGDQSGIYHPGMVDGT